MSAGISKFDQYARGAWQRFVDDPARARASVDALNRIKVAWALDVGCGAGHELIPFVREGAFGVGVDVAREVGRAGRELFAAHDYEHNIAFIRGAGEALPFAPDAFDLVICRLVLPYTDNGRALKEFARVLRPGGALVLKIDHARYYLREFGQALMSGHFLHLIYTTRVLLAGVLYHGTGRQPRGRFPGSETFQTLWLLKREVKRVGLTIKSRVPDANYLTPSFLILKANAVSSQRA